MLKSFVEKIQKLVEDSLIVEVGGRPFSATKMIPVVYEEKTPAAVCVNSLGAFCDFVNLNLDGRISPKKNMILVCSPTRVELVSAVCDTYSHNRETDIIATLPDCLEKFPFGKFISQEEFSIKLRSLFQPQEATDLDYLLAFNSKIRAENNVVIDDDGITQIVSTSKGLSGALVERKGAKSVVKIAPYRTFREVNQPQSEFLFRIKSEGSGVQAALFEADGGAWCLDAMSAVKDYISERVSIPVIS